MVLHFTYEAGSFTVPEFANSAHRTLQLALGILSPLLESGFTGELPHMPDKYISPGI